MFFKKRRIVTRPLNYHNPFYTTGWDESFEVLNTAMPATNFSRADEQMQMERQRKIAQAQHAGIDYYEQKGVPDSEAKTALSLLGLRSDTAASLSSLLRTASSSGKNDAQLNAIMDTLKLIDLQNAGILAGKQKEIKMLLGYEQLRQYELLRRQIVQWMAEKGDLIQVPEELREEVEAYNRNVQRGEATGMRANVGVKVQPFSGPQITTADQRIQQTQQQQQALQEQYSSQLDATRPEADKKKALEKALPKTVAPMPDTDTDTPISNTTQIMTSTATGLQKDRNQPKVFAQPMNTGTPSETMVRTEEGKVINSDYSLEQNNGAQNQYTEQQQFVGKSLFGERDLEETPTEIKNQQDDEKQKKDLQEKLTGISETPVNSSDNGKAKPLNLTTTPVPLTAIEVGKSSTETKEPPRVLDPATELAVRSLNPEPMDFVSNISPGSRLEDRVYTGSSLYSLPPITLPPNAGGVLETDQIPTLNLRSDFYKREVGNSIFAYASEANQDTAIRKLMRVVKLIEAIAINYGMFAGNFLAQNFYQLGAGNATFNDLRNRLLLKGKADLMELCSMINLYGEKDEQKRERLFGKNDEFIIKLFNQASTDAWDNFVRLRDKKKEELMAGKKEEQNRKVNSSQTKRVLEPAS